MLRAKRRRTRMHDKEGNPIFNTKNATVKQNHYKMENNYLSYLKTKQNPNLGCKKYYSEEEIEEIHKNKLLASKYCKTKSVPRNPLQGYRKQLITDYTTQKTLPTTPTLNISNTEILSLLERIGLDYFNTPINFSGQYKLINKNQVIKLNKFNIFYEKLRSNNYEKYDISYFHSTGGIFNGWVLRYRNTKYPIYNVQYRYVVSDSQNNRSLVNALKNIITTNFFIQETNDAPFNKGFFGLIDTSITIKNGDVISLKDVTTGKVWEGTVYGLIYRNDSNIDRNQFYIGDLTKTQTIEFPYSSTDVSINGGPTITTNISYKLPVIGLIGPDDFTFTKTETIPESYCIGDMVKPQPINTVYKDNYAKSCGSYRKEGVASNDFCYNNVIKSVQNINGQINQAYNYTSAQYYSRFCANDCSNNCNIVYKKNNPKFSTQGAVSGGSRLNRLKYQTITKSQQVVNHNKKIVSNKVNGSQPVSIYRNTYPIYKQNLNGLVKCNTRAYNGARQNCPIPFNKNDCKRIVQTIPSACNRRKTLQCFK